MKLYILDIEVTDDWENAEIIESEDGTPKMIEKAIQEQSSAYQDMINEIEPGNEKIWFEFLVSKNIDGKSYQIVTFDVSFKPIVKFNSFEGF